MKLGLDFVEIHFVAHIIGFGGHTIATLHSRGFYAAYHPAIQGLCGGDFTVIEDFVVEY